MLVAGAGQTPYRRSEMKLPMQRRFHTFGLMNVRTILLIATGTALLAIPSLGIAREDNEAQAKARAAVRAADDTLTSSSTPASTAPIMEGSQPDSDAQAAARAALRDEIGAEEPPVVVEVVVIEEVVEPEPEEEVVVEEAVEPEPEDENSLTTGMDAPPLPTTDAQRKELAELLERYRADQVSAAQYHAQRAAILASQ